MSTPPLLPSTLRHHVFYYTQPYHALTTAFCTEIRPPAPTRGAPRRPKMVTPAQTNG